MSCHAWLVGVLMVGGEDGEGYEMVVVAVLRGYQGGCLQEGKAVR